MPAKHSLIVAVFLCGCNSPNPEIPDCSFLATWEAPTERENGNPFLQEHIEKFTLSYFNDETIVNIDVGPTIRGWEVYNLSGSLTFRVNVTSTDGQTSDWSNTKNKIFDKAC